MNPTEANSTAPDMEINRRSYLGWLIGLCTAGVGAVLFVPLVRFSLYPLRVQTTEVKWSDVGRALGFCVRGRAGTTLDNCGTSRRLAQNHIRKGGLRDQEIQQVNYEVLSAVCPHLGCSVQWSDAKQKFVCPCHVSCVWPDGSRLGGPTPRAMDSLQTQIQNGRLMVRYQYFRQLVPTKEVIG